MNQDKLLTKFFESPEEYIKFMVGLKEVILSNNDDTCFAHLQKKDGCFLYILSHIPTDRYIGDYVIPFRATQENIDIFNRGCKILAERLQILIDTDDVSQVPEHPPAFGVLTYVVEE